MVKLDIMSDPICPWCYVGKTLLDRALEKSPDHPFEIEWHPFQLNPTMPREGMDRRAYLEAKFGGKEGAVRAYAPVVEHAEKREKEQGIIASDKKSKLERWQEILAQEEDEDDDDDKACLICTL